MGLIMGIAIMGVFVLIGSGISWVFSRYFGSEMVGRGQLISSIRNSERLKFNLRSENPELVEKAIKECERKRYAKTPENIYRELDKLKYPKKTNPIITHSINKFSKIIMGNTLSNLINKTWVLTSQEGEKELWIFSKDNKFIFHSRGKVETGNWSYFDKTSTLFIELGEKKQLFNKVHIEKDELSMFREGTNETIVLKGENYNTQTKNIKIIKLFGKIRT